METYRDYGQDHELIKQFLREYNHVDDDGQAVPKYSDTLHKIANRQQVHFYVDMADIERFNHELARQVTENTTRYTQIFLSALDELLPAYKTSEPDFKDPMDIFIEQRLLVAERNQRQHINPQPSLASQSTNSQVQAGNQIHIEGKYPPDLIRRAELTFKPADMRATPIREVKSDKIGKFVTVRGIITRTTDVKPKVAIVTYTCDQCGCETFQPIRGLCNKDFMPLFQCTSAVCQANKTLGRITMQTRGSKFVKYQEIKLQEHWDQVPTGHIPRALTVMAYGEMTRKCSPGDHISVSGVFLPVERSDFRARMHGGGLTSDTCIEAHHISLINKTEDDELITESMTTEEALAMVGEDGNFLKRLSSSISPEIYGHEELKKALLLLLVGGVDKNSHGMKIRGNINICLMGDPGVAKSQMLGFVDRLAIRSQYTTGRGSSGVGLTAAVLRDPVTNELLLEGGALVLADGGVCCIDEFDKMMDSDRTAIHEVMEQQTVSIAKAGIMTTLNARVSILAAANPAYGRYNVHRSIMDNLQLPPALLSRFDLLWLIKDKPDKTKDLNLANHIFQSHIATTTEEDERMNDGYFIDMKTMRKYINLCKKINPVVPESVKDQLIEIYLEIRQRGRSSLKDDVLFTSPRSLLAILRLTTAFARLRLSPIVEDGDIKAACELYKSSRDSIEGALSERSYIGREISDLINQMSQEKLDRKLMFDEVMEVAVERGYSREDFMSAIETLKEIESIEVDDEGKVITLID